MIQKVVLLIIVGFAVYFLVRRGKGALRTFSIGDQAGCGTGCGCSKNKSQE